MNKIKISVVSYLNSKPFIYGLEHSEIITNIDLQLDIPSTCAQKLIDGKIDIGLIPVAALPLLKEAYIISDYCIGARGKVSSVMLYSNVPLTQIKTVFLDYQSKTSVALVKILTTYFWKINPEWIGAKENFENNIKENEGAVIIGDRTFELKNKYAFAYDLAEEWQKFTKLPFVFACWVANKKIDQIFINNFNTALKFGIDNREKLIEELKKSNNYKIDLKTYLNENISYEYDDKKKEAMNLFLDYISKLNSKKETV